MSRSCGRHMVELGVAPHTPDHTASGLSAEAVGSNPASALTGCDGTSDRGGRFCTMGTVPRVPPPHRAETDVGTVPGPKLVPRRQLTLRVLSAGIGAGCVASGQVRQT